MLHLQDSPPPRIASHGPPLGLGLNTIVMWSELGGDGPHKKFTQAPEAQSGLFREGIWGSFVLECGLEGAISLEWAWCFHLLTPVMELEQRWPWALLPRSEGNMPYVPESKT